MKKIISFLLTAALLLLPFQTIQAWSSFRNESGREHANTTVANTPATASAAGVKWQIRFAEGTSTACNSDPVITDTYLYVVCKDTLYQLNKNGGICSTLPLAASMNSICRMSLSEHKLLIPLSGGKMQCVEVPSMTPLWTSESFGLQSLTATYCANGCVYAGTTNAAGTEGLYYCLSAEDGSTLWTYADADQPCGYYWSGAISNHAALHPTADTTPDTASGTDYVLFGGDNGILVSHSATDDAVYDTYDLSSCDSRPSTARQSKIRAGITYDAHTDAYYTTSNDGYLYQIKMTPDGTFQSVTAVSLCHSQTAETNCTSTPTIYNDRIYVCSYDGFHGQLNVVDAASMHLIYSASSPDCRDIKSSPLVCTAYAAPENKQTVYVYFTQNALPGGIYFIKDDETSGSAEIQTLFTPDDGKQFCLSSVAADSDGTLYYSNDSGTLFAIQEGYAAKPSPAPAASSHPPVADAPVSPGSGVIPPGKDKPQHPNTSENQKKKAAGKPGKIKWSVKKKKNKTYRVTFTWKKGANTAYTKISIQKKTGTASQKQRSQVYKSTSAKKAVTLRKGTYRVSFYGCQSDTKRSGAVTRTLRLR